MATTWWDPARVRSGSGTGGESDRRFRRWMLDAAVVALAVWVAGSPILLAYSHTDAANDLVLVQLGAGLAIGLMALRRMWRPGAHYALAAAIVVVAAALIAAPWLLGTAQNEPQAGLPPGAGDNYYAEQASLNAVVSGSLIVLVTAAAAVLGRRAESARAEYARAE